MVCPCDMLNEIYTAQPAPSLMHKPQFHIKTAQFRRYIMTGKRKRTHKVKHGPTLIRRKLKQMNDVVSCGLDYVNRQLSA